VTLALYLDEDSMGRELVRAVRARGLDILTALEAGMVARADAEHLAFWQFPAGRWDARQPGIAPNCTKCSSMAVGALLGHSLTDGADDLVEGGAGAEHLADTHRLDGRHIFLRNDPAGEDDDIGHSPGP
jgi:hypothetical protein